MRIPAPCRPFFFPIDRESVQLKKKEKNSNAVELRNAHKRPSSLFGALSLSLSFTFHVRCWHKNPFPIISQSTALRSQSSSCRRCTVTPFGSRKEIREQDDGSELNNFEGCFLGGIKNKKPTGGLPRPAPHRYRFLLAMTLRVACSAVSTPAKPRLRLGSGLGMAALRLK